MKSRLHRRWTWWLLLLGCVSVGWVGVFTPLGQPLREWVSQVFDDETNDESASFVGLKTDAASHDKATEDADSSAKSTSKEVFDPDALPKGLHSVDGVAGEGINRSVKKNGVWFPVYSPDLITANGRSALNILPLTIASGPAPIGRVNESYVYQSEAIGGTPPYHWEAVLDPAQADWNFDAATGVLTGMSLEPLTAMLQLTVKDVDGATNSVRMPVVIRPLKALAILTRELPSQTTESAVEVLLKGEGGVPPYRWSSQGGWPEGLQLQADGTISGTPSVAGEFPISVTLHDAQNTEVTEEMVVKVVDGLEIATEAALPSVNPGAEYEITFEAKGGEAPYTWELTGGAFPQGSAELTEQGKLQGQTDGVEELASFTLTVRDAAEATFQKTFRLAVSHLLVAVPSAEKAGLAWSPAAVAALLRTRNLFVERYLVLRDEEVVYEGTGNNFVDHHLATGSSPSYTLLAATSDGQVQPLATAQVTLLPMGRERGVPGVRADPYADAVLAYRPLAAGAYGATKIPSNVTGPPDGHSSFAPANRATEVASLGAMIGAGGFIDLEFRDNILELGTGDDLTVFENVFFIGGDASQRFMEPGVVSVALFPGEWHRIPCDVLPPADGTSANTRNPFYYARGIAGRNATTGEDPTNPARSGGDSFDLEDALRGTGLAWIRFVRIQSTGDAWMQDDVGGDLIRHDGDPAFQPLSGKSASGFDLDAICALHEP